MCLWISVSNILICKCSIVSIVCIFETAKASPYKKSRAGILRKGMAALSEPPSPAQVPSSLAHVQAASSLAHIQVASSLAPFQAASSLGPVQAASSSHRERQQLVTVQHSTSSVGEPKAEVEGGEYWKTVIILGGWGVINTRRWSCFDVLKANSVPDSGYILFSGSAFGSAWPAPKELRAGRWWCHRGGCRSGRPPPRDPSAPGGRCAHGVSNLVVVINAGQCSQWA